MDLKLYLHELDEEFWLYRAVFPFPMENLDFQVKNTKPKSFVDLTISKTEIHKMNKTGFSCITNPPNDSFSATLLRSSSERLNCSPFLVSSILIAIIVRRCQREPPGPLHYPELGSPDALCVPLLKSEKSLGLPFRVNKFDGSADMH